MKKAPKKADKTNVLIVEDELIVGIDLKKTLERNGLNVIGSASTSSDAINFVKTISPDIILMDIMLKDSKDGVYTAEAIHSFTDIPVIFLTAFSDEDTIARAKQTSPYGYILKPFNEKELLISIEITLYKHSMEKRLKESEEKYKRLIEGSPDISYGYSKQNGAVYWSERIKDILGYAPNYLIKNPFVWHDSIHPDDLPMVDKAIDAAITGESFEMEYRIKDKKNKWHWFRDRFIGRVLKDDDVIIEGLASDITIQKTAQEEIQKREAKLNSIFKAAPVGIGVNINRVLVEVNDTFCSMIGYSKSELIGKNARILYPTDDDYEFVGCEKYRQISEFGTGTVETKFRRKNGEVINVILSSTPLDRNDLSKGVTFTSLDITDRKLAELALEASEKEYRRIVETAHEGILGIDEHHFITYVNDRMAETFGYEISGMIGQKIEEFIFEEDLSDHKIKMENRQQGANEIYERRFKMKTGDEIWMLVSASAINDEDGTFLGSFGMFTDITDRKKTEEALKTSEEKFRRIYDDSPVGALVVDIDQRFTSVNKAFCDFLGYPKDELIGKKISDITFEDDMLIGQSEIKKMLLGELDTAQVEKRYVRKNGEIVWGQVNISLLRDKDKKPLYFLPIIIDITERKKAQLQLLDSEITYRGMINSVGEAIYIQAGDGKFLDVNLAAEKLYGYSKEEFIGKTPEFLSATGKNDLDAIKKIIAEASKGNSKRFEFWGKRKDGTIFPKEVSISQCDYFGRKALIAVARDISERKKTEHVLRENHEKLQAVINATPDIICFKDAYGRWIQANDSILNLYQLKGLDYYNKSELELASYAADMYKEVFKISKSTDENAWALGRISRTTEIIPDINHNKHVFDMVKIPLYNEDHSRRGLVVFGRDITEIKKTEEALVESEERYRRIFENTHTAMLIIDPLTAQIVDANPASELFYGWSRDILKKMNIFEINILPLEEIKYKMEQARFGKKLSFEFKHKIADGTIKDVEIFSGSITLGGRELLFSIVHDITQRKLAEEKLLESESRFRTVVTNATPIIFMIDNERKFVLSEGKMLASLGLKPGQVVGQSAVEIYKDFPRIIQGINTALSGQHFDDTIDVGGIIFDIFYTPYMNVKGEVIGLIGMAMDITKRKHAENALRESEERFRHLFTVSPDAIMIIDPHSTTANWPIVDCNDIACIMCGYTREELIGQSVDILNTSEASLEERANYLDRLRKEGVIHYETFHRHRDGHVFPIEVATSIASFGGRELILGIDRDITERKQSEEAIRISEEKFRVSFLTSPDSININRLSDGLYVDINEGFTRLSGYTREDVLNKTSGEINIWVNPEDRKKLVYELLNHGVCQNLQTEFRLKDGTFKTCLMSASVITFGGEKCILSMTRDITEKVKHDIELNEYRLHLEDLVDQRTEEIKKHSLFLRTLIDTIPNPIFVKDRQGCYTEVNKAFEKFYGVTRDEILGKALDYLAPADAIELNEEYDAKLLNEHMSAVYESYYINKEGKRIDLLLHKASFGEAENKPEGLTGLVVDISKHKEMELKTREAYQKEKELNDMKTNFISTASHEFRTPLTTILTSADLLQMNFEKWSHDKILKHINRIQESVDYMTVLLEDVLTLSRSDRGKLVLTPVEVNLNELCTEILEHTKLQVKENHNLIFNYNAPSYKYKVDPKLLTHILSNLLTNAVKFSPMGGDIIFNVDFADGMLKFSVADHGIGIEKSDFNKLFEPFFRANNASDIKGSGLGMSIVKRAVEIHNGEINVESSQGEGTTFTVEIKLV
ncbi:MAG: PAS domain S-box protein [bacterium]